MSNPAENVPALDIGRAYTAAEAATILGLGKSSFNERVREGRIKPVFPDGERRYSGYILARILGWPLSDDPRDYLPFRGQRERMVAVMDRMEAAMDEARQTLTREQS